MREKKSQTYARKKRGKIAIILDSELLYEEINYLELFYKGANLEKRSTLV